MKVKSMIVAGVITLSLARAATGTELACGAPQVFIGDQPNDPNPVVSVDVSYQPSLHAWQVFHHHYNGMVAARAQQYAVEDWSDGVHTRWAGALNRNRALYMIAEAGVDQRTGVGYYEERLYDRSRGNRLDVHLRAPCRLVVANPASPVAGPALPVVPVVPVAPVQPPPQSTIQQKVTVAPAQAAPPIVTVAPVVVIPGVTGAGQYPAPPAPKPEEKEKAAS